MERSFIGYLSDRRTVERPLTWNERTNLLYLSHGLTLAMVADARGVSLQTVKDQVLAARYKLAAKNRTHAVAIALRHGIIQ